jgi:ferredoxin-NADP reductase
VATTFTTALIEKLPRTPGTMSFRFARKAEYTFQPGQWFVIALPLPASPGSAEPLTHHFTHSNSPAEPFLEFTTRLTGSPFKQAMEAMSLGTEVIVEGPYGGFVLTPELERVAFITGGIGVTPVRSILRDLTDRGEDREIVVFYGNDNVDTITFRDELDAIAAALAGVRIVHVLARADDRWQGWRGFVRREVIEGELDDPAGWQYYVSGPPGMVKAVRDTLRTLEIPRAQTTLENFEGYE